MPRWLRVATVLAMVGAGVLGGVGAAGAQARAVCDRGALCLWTHEGYRGAALRLSLVTTNPGECVPLPAGFAARSFANRISRHVTVYQGGECETEGEFDTYPGGGTYVPEAPYVVRAVQIWD